LFSYNTKK